jgi:hypothetical protein
MICGIIKEVSWSKPLEAYKSLRFLRQDQSGIEKKKTSMSHTGQPLAEVFGFLITDQTDVAKRYRSRRLCPFNNKVPKGK